jgi:hypothetical protein
MGAHRRVGPESAVPTPEAEGKASLVERAELLDRSPNLCRP